MICSNLQRFPGTYNRKKSQREGIQDVECNAGNTRQSGDAKSERTGDNNADDEGKVSDKGKSMSLNYTEPLYGQETYKVDLKAIQ